MEEKALCLGEGERIVKRYDFPQDFSPEGEDSLIFTDKRVIKRDVCGEMLVQKEVLLSEIDQVETVSYPRNIIEVSGTVRNIKSLEFFMLISAIALLIASYVLGIIYDFSGHGSVLWILSIVLGGVALLPLIIGVVKLLKRRSGSVSVRKKALLLTIVSIAVLCFIGYFFLMGYHRFRLNVTGVVVGGISLFLLIIAGILFALTKKRQQAEKKVVLKISVLKRATDACALSIEKEFDTSEEAAAITAEIGALVFRLSSDDAAK